MCTIPELCGRKNNTYTIMGSGIVHIHHTAYTIDVRSVTYFRHIVLVHVHV